MRFRVLNPRVLNKLGMVYTCNYSAQEVGGGSKVQPYPLLYPLKELIVLLTELFLLVSGNRVSFFLFPREKVSFCNPDTRGVSPGLTSDLVRQSSCLHLQNAGIIDIYTTLPEVIKCWTKNLGLCVD